jgi:hypothetical protein
MAKVVGPEFKPQDHKKKKKPFFLWLLSLYNVFIKTETNLVSHEYGIFSSHLKCENS